MSSASDQLLVQDIRAGGAKSNTCAKASQSRIVFVHAERPPLKLETMTGFVDQSGLSAADTWYFADSFLERLRFEIDPGWHGELPKPLLLDRNGTVKTIIGSADLGEIRQWLHNEGAAR